MPGAVKNKGSRPDLSRRGKPRTGNDPAASPSETDRPEESVVPPVYHLEGVSKRWSGDSGFILTVPHLRIAQGEKIALVGYSGCGKSTLLDMMTMVLRPDKAQAFSFCVAGTEPLDVYATWHRNDQNRLADTRMRHMGYVLQTGGLLPFLSVRDNIGISLRGLGRPTGDAVEIVAGKLGIERHLNKKPGQLSVGERQRVAIARAMAHKPAVVIADEPTASLDPINAEEILKLFAELVDDFGVTLIMATHDWDRVKRGGFRLITFDVRQDKLDGSVCAMACV